MGYEPEKEPVQLEGAERENARRALGEIDVASHSLGEIVLDRVHGKQRERAKRLKHARIAFDNSKFIISDGESCGVYEEPPGICRDCSPEEAAQF